MDGGKDVDSNSSDTTVTPKNVATVRPIMIEPSAPLPEDDTSTGPEIPVPTMESGFSGALLPEQPPTPGALYQTINMNINGVVKNLMIPMQQQLPQVRNVVLQYGNNKSSQVNIMVPSTSNVVPSIALSIGNRGPGPVTVQPQNTSPRTLVRLQTSNSLQQNSLVKTVVFTKVQTPTTRSVNVASQGQKGISKLTTVYPYSTQTTTKTNLTTGSIPPVNSKLPALRLAPTVVQGLKAQTSNGKKVLVKLSGKDVNKSVIFTNENGKLVSQLVSKKQNTVSNQVVRLNSAVRPPVSGLGTSGIRLLAIPTTPTSITTTPSSSTTTTTKYDPRIKKTIVSVIPSGQPTPTTTTNVNVQKAAINAQLPKSPTTVPQSPRHVLVIKPNSPVAAQQSPISHFGSASVKDTNLPVLNLANLSLVKPPQGITSLSTKHTTSTNKTVSPKSTELRSLLKPVTQPEQISPKGVPDVKQIVSPVERDSYDANEGDSEDQDFKILAEWEPTLSESDDSDIENEDFDRQVHGPDVRPLYGMRSTDDESDDLEPRKRLNYTGNMNENYKPPKAIKFDNIDSGVSRPKRKLPVIDTVTGCNKIGCLGCHVPVKRKRRKIKQEKDSMKNSDVFENILDNGLKDCYVKLERIHAPVNRTVKASYYLNKHRVPVAKKSTSKQRKFSNHRKQGKTKNSKHSKTLESLLKTPMNPSVVSSNSNTVTSPIAPVIPSGFGSMQSVVPGSVPMNIDMQENKVPSKSKYLMIKTNAGTFLVPTDSEQPAMVLSGQSPTGALVGQTTATAKIIGNSPEAAQKPLSDTRVRINASQMASELQSGDIQNILSNISSMLSPPRSSEQDLGIKTEQAEINVPQIKEEPESECDISETTLTCNSDNSEMNSDNESHQSRIKRLKEKLKLQQEAMESAKKALESSRNVLMSMDD